MLRHPNNDLGGIRFGIDSDGKYGYIIEEEGADTVIPFKKNEIEDKDLFDKILGIAFFTLGYNSSTDGYEYSWNKVGDVTASGTFSNARYTITIGPGKYLKYININNSTKDPEIITLTANTKYSSVVYAVFIKISE